MMVCFPERDCGVGGLYLARLGTGRAVTVYAVVKRPLRGFRGVPIPFTCSEGLV